MKLLQGDCLELMKQLPDGSVDAIITDPPYGITENKWDKPIELAAMWREFDRVLKQGGVVVSFGLSGFTIDLINSNRTKLRHWWVWYKHLAVGYLNANKAPLRVHEDILVFCSKSPIYFPQKTKGKPYIIKRGRNSSNYNTKRTHTTETDSYYPQSILDFPAVVHGSHPTQKPVELLEYLIKTYSRVGEVVLDPFMGSGTTGVACRNLGREFIGIELDPVYFAGAKKRIESTQEPLLVEG